MPGIRPHTEPIGQTPGTSIATHVLNPFAHYPDRRKSLPEITTQDKWLISLFVSEGFYIYAACFKILIL